MSRVSNKIRNLPSDSAVAFGQGHGKGLCLERWLSLGLALLAVASALGFIAAGDKTLPSELDGMLRLQGSGWSELDVVAWNVSRLGDALPALLVVSFLAAVGCALRGRTDLAMLVLAASLLRGIGPTLKWVFASPRPPIDVVTVSEHVDGFGYPSGHAFGAALVYGAIILVTPQLIDNRARRGGVQAFAVIVIGLIAISRVRLGVHWPSDVIGGLAFGVGLLCVLQAASMFIRARRVRM